MIGMSTRFYAEQTFASRRRLHAIWILALAVLLLSACGGAAPQPTQPSQPTTAPAAASPAPAVRATPITPAPAPTQPPAGLPADIQTRIIESLNRTMGLDTKVLQSYHLEVAGSDPEWNKDANRVDIRTYTLKADVSDEDVHFVRTGALSGQTTETIEGYIVKGGIGNVDKGGKDYVVEGGRLVDAFGVSSALWAILPAQITGLLLLASIGPPQFQGAEVIEGYTTEKYLLDSATAPAGVGAALGLTGYFRSRGTVWIDRQTGALFKAQLEYEVRLLDPPGTGTEVGKGTGRVDFVISQVGKVKVTLPPQ